MDQLLGRDGLRRRLQVIRIVNCGPSMKDLAALIGVSESVINWFLHNKRQVNHKSYGLILRYVTKMEKELEIK